MALYEDESMVLRNPGEAPPEGFVLKGQMGPVGQEQDYYERPRPGRGMSRNEMEGITPVQGQGQSQMPVGGDINQFLDWAVKNKLGFNPLTMNPTTEAMNKWNSMEANAFQQVFGQSGMSPSNMTPDALRHWNEQKKMGMELLIKEAENKQRTGIAYLNMLKEEWDAQIRPTNRTTIDKTTGKEVYLSESGQPTNIEKPSGSDRGQYVGTSLDAEGNPVAVVFNPKSQSFSTQPYPEGKAPMPKQIAEGVKNEIGAVNQTQDLIDGLERQWTDMKIVSRGDAVSAFLSGKSGNNPTAKAYADLREAFLGQLSRSIAAERGVLTNQDIERIKKALPAIGINPMGVDNEEEAAKKWKEIYTIIENAKKRSWEKAGMSYNTVIEPRSKQAERYLGEKKEQTKNKTEDKAKSGREPSELPAGWTRDANGNVFNDKGKKMRWRD